MRRIANILESVVVAAIVLVLVHTFLEDFAVLAAWPVEGRKWIIWAGLGFDIFFTIEFFARLYTALVRGEAVDYFFRQRGWIDFLASIPLLLFNSLPNVLALLAGAGLISGLGSFLNVLKVIKAVRIARILRLMRIVKLFRSIRYARSPMAQRHIALITTISVTLIVFWMLGSTALERLGVLGGLETTFIEGQTMRARSIAVGGADAAALARQAGVVAALDPTVLLVRQQGGPTAWSRFDRSYYASYFLPGDYGYFSAHGIEVFLDERPAARAAAREAMVLFVAVVLIVLGLLFLYAPRFALGVTDPIHIMRRGMAEHAYSLEVKIPPEHAEDDIFELAALYNSVFLPLKDREGAGSESQETVLDLDAVKDLVDRG